MEDSGERESNEWSTCPETRDSRGKLRVIPDNVSGPKVRFRLGMAPLPISLLVRQWLTKAMMGTGCESMTRLTGTETLPRHLRVAAVENLRQWTQVRPSDAACGMKAFGL